MLLWKKESSDFMIQPPKFTIYEDAKKDMSQVGGSLWLYIVMQLCMSFVFSFVLAPVSLYFFGYDYSVMNALITMIISLISGMILLWFINSSFRLKLKDLNFSFKPRETIDTIGMMYFFNYMIGLIGSLLSKIGLPDTSPDLWLNGNVWYDIFTFISVVILAPIFEELIFRGMILRTLSKYNKVFAIVITSLFFALLHLNITQAVPAFFMSLVLCYMSLKTNSLLVTILAHATNNLLALLSTYFDGNKIILVVIMALVVYGLMCLILRNKEISLFINEESTQENWYGYFFKRIPNALYVVFTIIWILFSLIRSML